MCGSHNDTWLDRTDGDEIKMGMEYEFYTDSEVPKNEILLKTLGYHFEYEIIAEGGYFGYEMKSPILSLKNWKSDFKIFWSNVNRIKNSKHCGIHVNITRNIITERRFPCIFRFLKNNRSKFKKLSGRKDFYYTNFNLGHDKYYSVLSSRKTLAFEFRLFAATKENSAISMETAHLLFSHIDNYDFTWNDFCKVALEDKKYKTLAKKIKKLDLVA